MNQNRPCLFQVDKSSSSFCRSLRGLVASLAIFLAAPALHAQDPAVPATEAAASEAAATDETEKKPEAAEEPAVSETPPANVVNREKVVADEAGRIQFNYAGQPWSQVLQDYADAASFSLDWQELPTDALNLTTQRTYSLAEAHDLLNRHLLARGFTMLTEGEVLSVVKVDKLDPSLIPRATAADLKDFAPHDFMRVTFDLPPVMDPAKAAEDVKLLLSPNAKVTPLLASRRLLVIDAVTNLREVDKLLSAEREEDHTAATPREYVLKYRRADYVAEQVLVVLGLDPNVIKTPDELKLETQRIQMQMKLIEKAKDVSKMIKNDGPKVHVAVNRRRNSILVNAPADLMGIVERTVKQLDVPDLAGEEGESTLSLKQYQLVVANPSEIIKALQDIVRLDPRSRLQGDSSNKSLLATATEVDHKKILEIIAKLDVTMPDTIDAQQLGDQDPHDFVRVRFQLPFGMNPSEVATKVHPLLSGNSKVLSLPTSRRLLIVDTVENLLEARELIETEITAFASKDTLRNFVMQYRPADEVASQVLTMLGLGAAGLKNPQGARFNYQGVSLYVSVNKKSNRFRVSSSPELLELIEQMVKRFDIAETTGDSEGTPAPTIVLYKVVGQNITTLISMFRDFGDVGPLARLQTGPASDTLYAIASAEDHEKISRFLKTVAPQVIKMVEPESLESLPPQELVRVRFQMPLTAIASRTASQLRGLTTSRGIVQSLESSKQIIVLDTAENLINIRAVLNAEIAALETQSVIKEFPIKHRNASEMVEQVLTMVGLDPTTVRSPYQLRIELKAMKLFITANEQRNSLIVNAAPDKLELIGKIVEQLDVPRTEPLQGDADRLTMIPYKVTGRSVAVVTKTLKEAGNFSPRTRLQGDPASRTLYAYATKEDHKKIREFVTQTDPNFVRHVAVDQLDQYPEHERVRVRFQLLPTADVLRISTQIRGILGTVASVQALDSSKQLVVTDTVGNLLGVREILFAEEAAHVAQKNIREFPLKHRRASEMVEQVLTMLGVNPQLITNPNRLQQELRRLKLFITANEQRNSLVVNAQADKMQMVEQIVSQLDVPQDGAAEVVAAKQTMVPYRIAVGDITSVAKVLTEIGNLAPRTRLQSDPRSKTLYAYASKSDHQKIRQFLDEMDPNIVRRVEADDLEENPGHEIVRVIFQLPLSSDISSSAKQVQGMLGRGARVQSLALSKQLVVVETVANLIDVRDLLYGEQLAAEALEMPMVFPLSHRRAAYVADQVMILLGLDPSARKTSSEVQFEAQRMQMMIQEASRQGRDISKIGEQSVFIAVNLRQNSLLVNAPADKIPMIERTIEQIDVPVAGSAPVTPGPLTMEKYQMVTAGTDGVIRALEEIGNLAPMTQLQTDETGKVIYAYATQADHEVIKRMIDKLDGTGRRPEVRWLPVNLPADQVAGSIMSLVVGPKKKKKNNLPWYFYRNNNDDEEEESNDGFRVLPDIENNRLLLWATDGELKEVDDFIAKLSERGEGRFNDRRKVRRLEARDPEATQKLLEQLRSAWPGKNKLEIESPPAKAKPEEKQEEPTKDDKLTRSSGRRLDFTQPTWLAQVAEKPAEEEAAPPIKISINKRGEIVLASDDTVALDQLQALIEQLSPVQTEFKSFQLRYIHVTDARFNLEDYFEDEMGDKGKDILDWWGRRQQTKPAPKPLTLGKRPPLRFVDDVRTNTLIVSNASSSQIRVIEEMIELYDQPPNPDLYYHRRTEAVKIKYSQAADIAESLKEVYRDLLSSKDKEFRTKEGKQAVGPSRESSYIFGNARRTVQGSEGPVLVRFSGALSIGVDQVSNSVVVSAREEVLEEIKNTIAALDKAAKSETVVRIHSASGVLNAEGLQRVIAETLSQPWIGGQPVTGSSNKK